jgi:hypothetical protein
VQRILVAVGPRSYWLRSDDGVIACGRELASIERAAANEDLPFAAWATELLDDIAQQNFVNHEALVALRSLVETDRLD